MFFNSRERRLRSLWRLLIQLVVVLFLVFASYMVLAVVVVTLNAEKLIESEVLGAVIQSFALVAATVFCFKLLDRRSAWGKLNRLWLSNFVFGMLLGALAMALIMLVEYQLGWVEVIRVGSAEEQPWWQLLGSMAVYWLVFTAVAFGEEALSRGYHLKNVSEGMRFVGRLPATVFALIFTSGLFGLLHWFNPNTSIMSTIGVTLAGMMLAFARVATGTLAAPIGIHLTWNFFQGPVFGFAVSGNSFFGSLVTIRQLGPETWTGGAFGPEAGLLGVVAVALITICLWWRSKMLRLSIRIEMLKLAHYRTRKKKAVPEPINATVIQSACEID